MEMLSINRYCYYYYYYYYYYIIIIISEIDTSLNLCVTLVMHLIQKDGEDIKTGTQIWLECGSA